MTSVWSAASQTEREQSQAAFNDFLRLWAKTESQSTEDDDEKEETNFRKQLANDEFATKTLFYLAGYALPFLSDAARDRDPFIRAQAVLAYPSDGQRLAIKLPIDERSTNARWSPDGRYVQIAGDSDWLIFDMQTLRFHKIRNVEDGNGFESSRGWSPWSKDGTRLTFVRDGQVWVSDALGNGAKQLTFDATAKALPTFSPDGRSVAYRSWQSDNRRHYPRIGRTDLWVVDVASTLVTRLTRPANGKIMSFDWIDDQTLICDRLEEEKYTEFFSTPRSSLRRISLNAAAKN